VTWLRAGAQSRNARIVPGPGGGAQSRSQLTVTNSGTPGTNTVLSKQFATGADLLVGFANSFVWQLAGPQQNTTNSILNFSLIQPLLRAGGRIVTLEQLTIVERTLLANLRAYERWRHGWFSFVATGSMQNVAALSRRGGGFGGTGLSGFSGQGVGGLAAWRRPPISAALLNSAAAARESAASRAPPWPAWRAEAPDKWAALSGFCSSSNKSPTWRTR
jgi:hypothetical protein